MTLVNGQQTNLDTAIQTAVETAREVAAEQGDESPEAAVAWDIVEELQAEASHQRTKQPQSSLERYCDQFPEAIEARIYDD